MNKSLFYIMIMIFSCLVLVSCDNQINEELKLPEPTFIVNGKEVSYKRGTYSWSNDSKIIDADSSEPSNLVENMESNAIPSAAELMITFDYEPSKVEGGIWENDSIDFVSIKNNKINLPDKSSDYIYVIHATWEEGDAIYVIPFESQ